MSAEPSKRFRGRRLTRTRHRPLARKAAHYFKFVEWSEEDGAFVGRCPTLFSGGVHGQDEAKVYAELCEVAEEWIALLEKEGQELPDPDEGARYSGKFLVRVDPHIHRRLALKARAAGESLNSFCAKALGRS